MPDTPEPPPNAFCLEDALHLFDYLPGNGSASLRRKRPGPDKRRIVLELPQPTEVTGAEIDLFEAYFASFVDELISRTPARERNDDVDDRFGLEESRALPPGFNRAPG
jgi:hypothetical protein